MAGTTFKNNSVGWQLRLVTQRVGEWWELKTSELAKRIPDVPAIESEWVRQIIKVILWSIIAMLLVWIIWQTWLILKFYLRRWRRERNNSLQVKPPETIKTLSSLEWVMRSQQMGQEGNYQEAILCLYRAMLQKLDERGIIPDLASRTDGEYLYLIKQLQLSQIESYQSLLLIHQRLCFSETEVSLSLFEQCQQAYQKIE
jgi:hypothetical protein